MKEENSEVLACRLHVCCSLYDDLIFVVKERYESLDLLEVSNCINDKSFVDNGTNVSAIAVRSDTI